MKEMNEKSGNIESIRNVQQIIEEVCQDICDNYLYTEILATKIQTDKKWREMSSG